MKSALSFFLIFSTIFAVCFLGCASHRISVQAPKLVVIVSTQGAPIPSASAQTDSTGISEEFSSDNIDSLIECADSACANDDFGAAHALLQEAIQSIKGSEEFGDAGEIEDNYKKIANFYMESMPQDYADSLPDEISLLTFRKQLSRSLDTIKISSSDSIQIQQSVSREKTNYDIPMIWNDRVFKALYFLNRGGKGSLDKWISKSSYYVPTIKRMLVDSGMPTDLAYLPLIESGFNPLAYSRAHASGMWQFIRSTGKRYGLQTDCWVDERRDFIKSTGAAISYFKKLYNQFNDWHIAIGSYNCGENGMMGAIGRARQKDFWSLRLPRETMHYVPEFIAALIAAKNPNYLNLENRPAADTFDLDTVTVKECLSLYAVADSLNVSSAELRRMNPHILHWCTHPRIPVTLYLPSKTKEKFLAAFDRSPFDFIVAWYVYKVKAHENFSIIARRFKVPPEALLSLNSKLASQRLSIGQELLIPIPTNQGASRGTAIGPTQQRAGTTFKTVVINGAKVIKYRVKPGDCLGGLARLFRVDKNDLRGWNNLSGDKSLRSGMMLTIYASPAMRKIAVTKTDTGAAQMTATRDVEGGAVSISSAQKPVSFIADAASKRIFYYRIRKGDNLWNIAQSFRVAIRQLTSINDITPDTALLPGKVIKVPLLEEL
jgi:membrane-bound lytic murein transglycosylase D